MAEQNPAEEVRDLIDQAAANCRDASYRIRQNDIVAPWTAQVEHALDLRNVPLQLHPVGRRDGLLLVCGD